MHAFFAHREGMEVIHIERSATPDGASVRNFGLIWVSGRAPGAELTFALRARELWQEVGSLIPETGFRGNGSLTLARNESERATLLRAAELPDAHLRQFDFLKPDEARKLEPSLGPDIAGALRCKRDATVEPNLVLEALRRYLIKSPRYSWRPLTDITEFYSENSGAIVITALGERISSDFLLLSPGSDHDGVCATFLKDAPLRRVRLQMAETENLGVVLKHSLADIDSLRYYPAFANCDLSNLPEQSEIAAKYHMQLLVAQRKNGGLTIGDTHEYEEPFEQRLREEPYDHLRLILHSVFGRELKLARKWDGVYSQVTDSRIYFRKEVTSRIHIVTGMGGRGNTISPAVAEETISLWRRAS